MTITNRASDANKGETTLALVMDLRVIACGIAMDVVDGLALFLVFFG